MRKIMLALAAILIASPAAASDKDDILKVMNTFMNGAPAEAMAACADHAVIIDEFPPHAWQSCAEWSKDFDAYNKANKITVKVLRIVKPKHIDITGDHAYVVTTADYSFETGGKVTDEKNAIWTVSLLKSKDGWHITGWAWARM